jgi:hypothetical protein
VLANIRPNCAGNGPSGISLSYLLSGNWPYYKGGCQDEMLHARLTAQPHLSLLEQDLEFLSDVSHVTEVTKVKKVMKVLAYT